MKTYKKIYSEIYSIDNLIRAWRKARKGKTKKEYVTLFEKDTMGNLFKLQKELIEQIYEPKPLKIFIIRDPKTRKIAKSAFRDRVIHHALVKVIEPIFDKIFIYDSCANRKGKGNLFALKRFDEFKRKVSSNGKIIKNNFNNTNYVNGYCFKADIKHYFQEVDHDILINLIKKKIQDEKVIWLIEKILKNRAIGGSDFLFKGMPLGNLTSQFFANIYLNELDYFVKHQLKSKYYLRYVDDFIILNESKKQLEIWKKRINEFLIKELKLEFHPDKSKIIPLSRGIDFVGFRNFYHFRLLRKRNIRKIISKINEYNTSLISEKQLSDSLQGWCAYARWANSFNLLMRLCLKIGII
jgi:retron-type reverse transcriptase